MRVCILTHTFPRFPGDTISSIFMAELAQSLVYAGNKVWVLTPYSPLFQKTKKDYKVITYKYIFPDGLHKLGYSETLSNDMSLPFVLWLLSPFMFLFGFIALLKLVKKEKIDLINAHWILPNGFIAGAAALFTGTPVVSTLPGSDVYMAQKNLLFNVLARIATWRSRWITSNSPQLIADLEKATQINIRNRSSNILYGVGSDKFRVNSALGKKTRKLLGFSTGEIVILGVGRLVAKKGFKYLIHAAKSVIKKHKNTQFVLIGDGEERSNLEKLVNRLGIGNHFRFLGNISYAAMNGYYNMADIFILPSVRDSKGNLDDQSVAVVDAMVCAKPVVTSDFPGYQLVINNGQNGILVKPKDISGITTALNHLIISPRLRKQIGRRARAKIVNKLSWRVIGKAYTELFENLVSNYYSLDVPKINEVSGRLRIAGQIMNVLTSEISQTRQLSLLDVGCSSGIITDRLADHFKQVIGVDRDRVALKLAARFKRKNLRFIEVSNEKLNFKDNSFDVVVCNQVYNFVANPKLLLSEIRRVLKPGGLCFFGARNKYALIEPQYNLPFASWFPRLLPQGKNYLSYWQLRKLVSGFKLNDYTLKVLRDPAKYGFTKIAKFKFLARILPLELLEFLIPNYIWILKK